MRTPGLSRLEKRRPRGNLIGLCSSLRKGTGEGSAKLCSWDLMIGGMHGNRTKMHQGKFRHDYEKFPHVRNWNRLPIVADDAPCL